MSTISEALTTLAHARRALGIPTADTTNDTLIENLIDAATLWIQDQCNRKFGRRNYNDTTTAHSVTSIGGKPKYKFSGDGSSYSHVLPDYPVDSGGTFTLEELSSRDTAGTETWSSTGYVTGYDYVVEWDSGIIRLLGKPFSNGILNYRVTYEAGYEEPAAPSTPAAPWVPADLQRACNIVVKRMYKGGDDAVITSERIGAWSRSFDVSKEEHSFVERTINKYKSQANLIL